MPTAIQFHLDEHIHGAIADALRRRGIDVSTTAEADLTGAADEEQLDFALSQDRVIVTHDHDFLRLHQQGVPHAGIAYCHQGQHSVGDLLRTLILIFEHLTPEDMRQHVEFL